MVIRQFLMIFVFCCGFLGISLPLLAGQAVNDHFDKVTYAMQTDISEDISKAIHIQQKYLKFSSDIDITLVQASQNSSANSPGHLWYGINLQQYLLSPSPEMADKEIIPLNMFYHSPYSLFIHKKSSALQLEDLIYDARKNPGRVKIGGVGKQTASHLAHLRFEAISNTSFTYLPFHDFSQAVEALEKGEIDALWGFESTLVRFQEQLHSLGIAVTRRKESLQQYPTFMEQGYNLIGGAYHGLAVSAKTPEELRESISYQIEELNILQAYQAEMSQAGFSLLDIPYEEINGFIKTMTPYLLNEDMATAK